MQAQYIQEGKLPPQAPDIEAALLGAIMLERETWEHIPRINLDIWYKEVHRNIFAAIKQLHTDSKEIDMLTVSNKLRELGTLEQSGGVNYLCELTKNIASGSHFTYHLAIVKEKYIRRMIIGKCHSISGNSYDETIEFEDLLSGITELNESVNDEVDSDMPIYFFNDVITEILNLTTQKVIDIENGIYPGIPIPCGGLQQMIGGWQNADLILIPARPSMGKTAVGAKFAKHAAKKGFRTVFFSLEMSKLALTNRMALGETDIDPEQWKNGEVSEISFIKVEKIQDYIKKWPLFINDKSGIRPEDIRAVCKKLKPHIIFIDYIQLMRPAKGRKYDNRNLELGNISHELKAIAKEFNFPVIALSQLSREVEKRGSKVPMLSDLRDSGELEQDADIIIFPYRPFVYSKNTEDEGVIEYITAKHRNGRVGIVKGYHNKYMNDFFDELGTQEFDYTMDPNRSF